MLVNVDGVWINPDHVINLAVDGQETIVWLTGHHRLGVSLPPDEVAAILNGEPELDENDWHPDKVETGTLSQFRDALRTIADGAYRPMGALEELNYLRGLAQAALDKESDDADV